LGCDACTFSASLIGTAIFFLFEDGDFLALDLCFTDVFEFGDAAFGDGLLVELPAHFVSRVCLLDVFGEVLLCRTSASCTAVLVGVRRDRGDRGDERIFVRCRSPGDKFA
jgi:hypothetical protein